jgi:hypothetical protein
MPTYYKCGSCNKVVHQSGRHFCSDMDFDQYLFSRRLSPGEGSGNTNIPGQAERDLKARAPDNS